MFNQKPPLGSQLIIGHPFAHGLVGCWLMNEGGGSVVCDITNNGYNGTLVSTCERVVSQYGSAIRINADGEGIDIPNAINKHSNNFTIILVFKCNSIIGDAHSHIMGLYDADADGFEIIQNSGTSAIWWANDNNWAINTSLGNLVVGNRHSLVYQYNNTYGMTLFLDGKIIDTDAGVAVTSYANNFRIGERRDGWSVPADMDVLSAFLYNRALTLPEITQLHTNPYQMFDPSYPIWAMGQAAGAAGIEVSATLDELVLTEYAATVNKAISFTAGLDELAITEYAATVNKGLNVSAGIDALTLTEYSANINKEVAVSAGVDALVITEYAATVNKEISFTASIDPLILTALEANVNAGINVSASLDTLTLTEYAVSIGLFPTGALSVSATVLNDYNVSVIVQNDYTVSASVLNDYNVAVEVV